MIVPEAPKRMPFSIVVSLPEVVPEFFMITTLDLNFRSPGKSSSRVLALAFE